MANGAAVLVSAIAVLLLAGCAKKPPYIAATPVSALSGASQIDLTGFWVRTDEAGSGNFGDMISNIPSAQLQPAAKAAAESEAAARAAADKQQEKSEGGVYRVKPSCESGNITFMMQHSGALDIVENDNAVLIIPEHHGAQHIYLDGRPHPAPVDWEPSGTGHSVGRWEGAALVVSTVGLTTGGGIPAGGRKSPVTELVERFRLRDAQHMTVSFTWNDPAIYVKPHSYEFTYEKQPADSYAYESWCDVTDPLQAQSIVVPPQK